MQCRTIFSLPIFGHDHVLDINCCRSYHLDFVLHLLCSVEKNVCLNACDTTSTTCLNAIKVVISLDARPKHLE